MNAASSLLAILMGMLVGGMVSAAMGRSPRWANGVGAASAALGSVAGLWVSARVLLGAVPLVANFALPWRMPLAVFLVGIDHLSAFFLVPVFGLGAVAAVYGGASMRAYFGRRNVGVAWFAFILLLTGMALLLLARNGILFLFAWELMSLAAWFLVAFDHERAEARRAGWIYLVSTHLGAAALFVLFLVLLNNTGAPDFLSAPVAGLPVTLILVLALIGFGAKAGIVPLHVWLPEAHAAAPSHVSAIMSGVMIKMGIYGILRIVSVVGGPPGWFGPFLMVMGLVGGILGIGMSLSQRDLKRALACSSIENVGIILLGVGLGCWGWATGNIPVAALGFAGGLLHVWNHAAMKGLMFLGAGSVLHGAGTKDLEALGGLMRRMPWTGALMTLGAVALAALPPLNGFVSEWLLYSGLIHAGLDAPGAAGIAAFLAVGALSLIGALAAMAFVRLVGVAFLGAARSPAAAHAHESEEGMLAPMAVLALVCVGLGLLPAVALGAAMPVAAELMGCAALAVPDLRPLGAISVAIWGGLGLGALAIRQMRRRSPAVQADTWGCGYTAPTARMQYTARGFARSGVDTVVPAALRPRFKVGAPVGMFPAATRLTVDYGDPAYERGYEPFFRSCAIRFLRIRQYQQGNSWFYIACIAAALALGLGWSSLRAWLL